MSAANRELPFTSRAIRPVLAEVLHRLQPGQMIRITHLVRVGRDTWPVAVEGKFRQLSSLATGIATHRLPQDDIIVATIHFEKENRELSSIALDEHTKVEIIADA